MKKAMLALVMTLALGLGAGYGPSAAFADNDAELAAAATQPMLGTVETAAVTGPISVGGITYIPCSGAGCAGSSATSLVATSVGGVGFLGTVQTDAVTGPIAVGGITYIP